ncbi:MAG: hypothetical protein ACTSUK_01030, partial [Promethearchaeota archaeon]
GVAGTGARLAINVPSTDNIGTALLFADDPTGISGLEVHSGAEFISTTDAITIPRMTAVQATAITAVNGMMLYVTTTNGTFATTGFWKYENGAWATL